MTRRLWLLIGLGVMAAGAAAWVARPPLAEAPRRTARSQFYSRPEDVRARLFEELQPVALGNCDMQRFGEPHDGGYLLCRNLLSDVKAAYSYGISGYDQWGCDVSRLLDVPVHRYDCFDTRNPVCPGAKAVFHAECVGPETTVRDGRPFDTIQNQVARNEDAGKQRVVKIDVEGAEWESFLQTPDAVFENVDQLVVEFHNTEDPRFVVVLQKLKAFFHVANLHFNNYSCVPGLEPFPAWAYEVLFVSKRLGVLDPSRRAPIPHAVDTPNDSARPDCQPVGHQ